MPLQDAIRKMYVDCKDTLYFNRFLDYLITKRFKKTNLNLFNTTATILVTGELVEKKTGNHYNSLAELYEAVSGKRIKPTDLEIFKLIWFNREYSLWRILCATTENDVVNFFDTKYRCHLMYHDVLEKMGQTEDAMPYINLNWNDVDYKLSEYAISPYSENPLMVYELLFAFENGEMREFYHYDDK